MCRSCVSRYDVDGIGLDCIGLSGLECIGLDCTHGEEKATSAHFSLFHTGTRFLGGFLSGCSIVQTNKESPTLFERNSRIKRRSMCVEHGRDHRVY